MSDIAPLNDIRPSPIAGRWYPGSAHRLAATIDTFITQAEVTPPAGTLIGLLVPHAGHRYSGPVAGHAFKLIQGMKVDVVALVGPSHYPYKALAVTTAHHAYETPLGQVPVDHAALDVLRQTVPIQAIRHDQEHSLEIELPFLQQTLGQFSLIPLALIDQSVGMAKQLGHALANLLAGKKALLVASSDLSHFFPQPVAHKLDGVVLDAVEAFDPVSVIEVEEQEKGFACGRGAIATVMFAARELGADTAKVVNYATSGDITQDYDQVVGYGAAVFYQASDSA